jgi:hypothetical protein
MRSLIGHGDGSFGQFLPCSKYITKNASNSLAFNRRTEQGETSGWLPLAELARRTGLHPKKYTLWGR